jgi:hypothetical protein
VREKKWEKLGLNGVGEFIFSTFESYNSKPQKPSSSYIEGISGLGKKIRLTIESIEVVNP